MTRPSTSSSRPDRRGPRSSRMGLVAFLLILLTVTVALPAAGLAGELRTGATITVRSGDTVADDLYLTAGRFRLDGRAEGDVSIAAVQATIRGQIAGSAVIAAGRADIGGSIGGSLRIVGGDVEIAGEIGGDLIVVGGKVTIVSRASIGGDLIVTGGNVDVRGNVAGDLNGIGGNVEIAGTVAGNTDIEANRLNVLNAARLNGSLRWTAANDDAVASGAGIQGEVLRVGQTPWSTADGSGQFGVALRALWTLIAGVLIVAIAPRASSAIGRHGTNLPAAVGIGLLALIIGPMIAAILVATTAGLAAGLLSFGLLVAVALLAQFFAGLSLGHIILPGRWNDGSRGYQLLAMTIGVLLLTAVAYIPFPYIGMVTTALVILWGAGAAFMVIGDLGARRPESPSVAES